MPEPIKRHAALQDLSRDHHQGLLLCFKIRQGLSKQVSAERIMNYCRSFYRHSLADHFCEEEQLLFPALGNEHPLVQKALEQHRNLNRLFTAGDASERLLQQIEQQLKAHIRFEERELFNEIQDKLGEDELAKLGSRLHRATKNELMKWDDIFWE